MDNNKLQRLQALADMYARKSAAHSFAFGAPDKRAGIVRAGIFPVSAPVIVAAATLENYGKNNERLRFRFESPLKLERLARKFQVSTFDVCTLEELSATVERLGHGANSGHAFECKLAQLLGIPWKLNNSPLSFQEEPDLMNENYSIQCKYYKAEARAGIIEKTLQPYRL